MMDFIRRHLEFTISLVLLTGLACVELIAHVQSRKIPEELLLWLILIFLANITRRLIYPGRHLTAVSNRLLNVQREVREIKVALAPDVWDRVEGSLGLFDENLKKVIGPNVEDLLKQLRMTFHEDTFELSNPQLFRSFYIRTLQTYSGASFMATSIARLSYFWGDAAIDNAISSFIQGGGHMKRIFFLASEDELNEDEPRRILLKQKQLGVEVFTIATDQDQVPSHLEQLFMVDSESRIAWEVIRGPKTASIKRVRLHWKQKSIDDPARGRQIPTESFRQIFDQLFQLPQIRKFTETDIIIDPQSNAPLNLAARLGAVDQTELAAFVEFEQEGWESSATAYGRYFSSLTQQAINYLLAAAEVKQDENVLDVATGPGYVASAVRSRGATVAGIDFSQKMIQIARASYPDIPFQVADACSLPFSSELFDAVLINFGVLHFGQPDRAFSEAWRVLKKGGRLGFTVWAEPEKALGLKIIFQAIEIYGNRSINLPPGPPFFKFSNPGTCEQELERNGFVKVDALELPLIWRLDSGDQFLKAFYEATVRARGMLRRQLPETLVKIKDYVCKQCQKYDQDGKLKIPMSAIMITAQKPE